jgi:phosphoribosylanthranilate isomerase
VRDSQQKRHTRMPKRVGVFVDDMPQTIVTRIYNFNLDFVQLNGDETPVMIENLKRTLIPDIAPNIRIIKTLPVKCVENLKATEQFEGLVDYFLFDLNGVGEGADNMQFAQSLLDSYRGNVPFLLSGGIGPDDTERIKNFNQPMFERCGQTQTVCRCPA